MENRTVPDWLKRLQENSWELELLISGGAIFSLLQVTEVFIDWIVAIRITSHFTGTGIVLMLGTLAIKILTLGFAVHLAMRSYWLALVCINYVYPNGIDVKRIARRRPFETKVEDGADLQDQITAVDRSCGTIMFISIVSVFVLLGLFLTVCVLLVFSTALQWLSESIAYPIVMVAITFFTLYVVDLLCFGLLRKIPLLSYLLFPFFKTFDTISFRSQYERPLFLFNTNVKRTKFVFTAILFATIALGLTYFDLYQVQHWSSMFENRSFLDRMAINQRISFYHYIDQWEDDKMYHIAINSKVQKSNYMELFVIYEARYDDLMAQLPQGNTLPTLDAILKVEIDGRQVANLQWYPTRLSNHSDGITTLIPTQSLGRGPHTIKVYSDLSYSYEEGKSAISENIPFWVDRTDVCLWMPDSISKQPS